MRLVPSLVVCLSAFAATTSAAVLAQQRISLAGSWQIAAIAKDGKEGAEVAITVPSEFETALGTNYDGIARYRRVLPLPPQRTAHVAIEFAAVATHATVRINGVEVGQHLGGWTPFRVDATAALQWNGADVLEVLVDEKVGHNTQGFHPIVQPHFGGIWQDVTLCLSDQPTLDRHDTFVFGTKDGTLRAAATVLGNGAATDDLSLTVAVRRSDRQLASTMQALAGAGRAELLLRCPDVRLWAPGLPELYDVQFELRRGGVVLDTFTQRTGFRDLRADGYTVRWNGEPLQLRGVLHWGYSPPHLAPPSDPAFWRPQLEYFRSLGFNTLKCCLWVPPRCVYELCDELGLCVWQEYPTWHPQMDQAHKQDLLREYAEFFAHDRSHPSVGFRSLTCETGHGADLDVVQALYTACKAAVPDTLVVDDSSWIGWQRVADFHDEHPYGNNSWWPGRLAEFAQHLAKSPPKPLLLGECLAADTWVDRAAWTQRHGEPANGAAVPWWRPDCLAAQPAAEAWLAQQAGPATLASLRASSLDFGLRNRQHQIEQLRLRLPFAGYVVSVARDFGKARMGLYDDLDQPKWHAREFAWHGDTMLCLDLPWHGHALAPSATHVPVRLSHFGRGPLRGELTLQSDQDGAPLATFAVELAAGSVSEPFLLPLGPSPAQLTRLRVTATLRGSHAADNHWDLWRVPPFRNTQPSGVRIATALTPALLDELEAGGKVLLLAGEQKGSPRTEALWFLRGAPFVVDHPLWTKVPREALLELSSFDLESGRVMPWAPWADQLDALLGFWETHDIPEVRWHLLAGETRVGAGRLLVTTLQLDDGERAGSSALRPWLVQLLLQHLRSGPLPQRELRDTTVAALRAQLSEKRLELPTWRFRTDPDDQGRSAGWQTPATDASQAPWRDLRAGAHWENQAEDLRQYTGVAWYRVDVDVPADWQAQQARAVFDGVDDSFELWLNGEPIAAFGDPATRTSIWLERQVAELGQRLVAGRRNTLVLRVVDHAGSGGLWKPVFLTTGPAGKGEPLLH